MRLSAAESAAIREQILALDPGASIYLYGSRTDPNARGGDIDLLVISDKLSFHDKISLLVAIKDRIGDQRIDLMIKGVEHAKADPFAQSILGTAIEI